MNKWQIICPVVAIALVVLGTTFIRGRKARDQFLQMATHSVGRDLIAKTNSSHLITIDPNLQKRLSELFASPAHIADVLLGDGPSPIGTGKACSRLVLTNEISDGIVMRLREADTPGNFHILSYWSIHE